MVHVLHHICIRMVKSALHHIPGRKERVMEEFVKEIEEEIARAKETQQAYTEEYEKYMVWKNFESKGAKEIGYKLARSDAYLNGLLYIWERFKEKFL